MYAQTIAYGLFTAKIGHAQNPGQFAFNRTTASIYITDRIPFLKGLFDLVLGTNSVSKIHKSIENLIELFNTIDMTNILDNFGQETRTEDPVIHFYGQAAKVKTDISVTVVLGNPPYSVSSQNASKRKRVLNLGVILCSSQQLQNYFSHCCYCTS